MDRPATVEVKAPSNTPQISRIWFDRVTHPVGASKNVTIRHEYIDWSDGAQTVRPVSKGAPWLCVHQGDDWPDAREYCRHISELTDGGEL